MPRTVDCDKLHGLPDVPYAVPNACGVLQLDEWNIPTNIGLWTFKYNFTEKDVPIRTVFTRACDNRQRLLNENVLDYLLRHKEAIPQEWARRAGVLFLGTLYMNPRQMCVEGRLLRVNGASGWGCHSQPLDESFTSGDCVVAVATD